MCEAGEGGCGAGGGEGEASLSPPRRDARRRSLPLKCMKCKEASPVLIIRVGDAFCKACFKDYFVHKFRAMLGKNRCIYPGEKVLLAFSGGPASGAMMRQVEEGLSQRAAKKLRFRPGILYVDDGAVSGQSLERREERRTEVEKILQATDFPYHVVCLEEVFGLPTSILSSLPAEASAPGQSYKEAVDGFIKQEQEKMAETEPASLKHQLGKFSLQNTPKEKGEAMLGTWPPPGSWTQRLTGLFGATKSLTAKEELLQTLRNHLILHVARTRAYTKVMTGESCTRVAVKLLTNLCLGRGAFLATDTGFSDGRHGDVLFLRPMREYPAKEIAFYNRLFGVPTVFMPALDTKAPDRASIHRLIESFLSKLQSDFPSTVSTVYRTGEKLRETPREANLKGPGGPTRCLLCLCALDTNVVEGSSLQSTLLSVQLSQAFPPPPPPPPPEAKDCGQEGPGNHTRCCKDSLATGDSHQGPAQLLPLLCYSCRLTVQDMSSVELLPSYIGLEAEHRRCRAAMKQEIQEFLLDEDPEATPSSPTWGAPNSC